MMDLLRETSWEPEKPNFDIDFLRVEFDGLEESAEVLDWLENGVPMGIDSEVVEKEAKQAFKEHSYFENSHAILKWTEETLKELRKGHIIGPFWDQSELWNSERLIKHRTGMITKKGES